MKPNTLLLLAVSLWLSSSVWAQVATTPATVRETSAIAEITPQAVKRTPPSALSFRLSAERIRSIVRAAATFQRVEWRVKEIPAIAHEIPASRVAAVMKLPVGPRFQTPSSQLSGMNDFASTWLSCQSSGNDMLSTFERYDHCRGVDIGIKNY